MKGLLKKRTLINKRSLGIRDHSADELLKWFELKNNGVITEEEFNTKKKELL